MNARAATYSSELRKVNSITLNYYLDQDGEITAVKTFNRGEMDREYHLFTAADRDGTYFLDNAGVSWSDVEFGSLVAAIEAGEEFAAPRGISEV